MDKDSAGAPPEDADGGDQIDRRKRRKDRSSEDDSDESDRSRDRRRSRRRSRERRRRRRKSESGDEDSSSSSSYSESESEENEEDEKRRRRKERRKRREREEEEERRERKRRKEKRRRRKEEEVKKRKEKKRKKEKELGKTGAVTNSWGKYGVIREIDMWNKRPEFSAWLAEVKQVNLETLSNWEEKQLFKEFMEDHNTATFPSKKYYDLNAYHRHQIEKEMKKGGKKAQTIERTVFNDEEQRRQELLKERERMKEEQVQALKYSMQSGMAQAMKEQAQLREEMAYQYKVGNFEAAAAIQRRLDLMLQFDEADRPLIQRGLLT